MKTCFKCRRELPLSDFYKHPKMADGHLGKCIACTRRDTAERHATKGATDIDWVLAERERHRLKAARLRAQHGQSQAEDHNAAAVRDRLKFPEKARARNLVNKAIRRGELTPQLCRCGAEAQAHHEDYAKPLEVEWLCPKHHAERHVAIRTAQTIENFNPQQQPTTQ